MSFPQRTCSNCIFLGLDLFAFWVTTINYWWEINSGGVLSVNISVRMDEYFCGVMSTFNARLITDL